MLPCGRRVRRCRLFRGITTSYTMAARLSNRLLHNPIVRSAFADFLHVGVIFAVSVRTVLVLALVGIFVSMPTNCFPACFAHTQAYTGPARSQTGPKRFLTLLLYAPRRRPGSRWYRLSGSERRLASPGRTPTVDTLGTPRPDPDSRYRPYDPDSRYRRYNRYKRPRSFSSGAARPKIPGKICGRFGRHRWYYQ
jgi:hypothetical protein